MADAKTPVDTPETLSRKLVRRHDRGVLSTVHRGDENGPAGQAYGSLVLYACDHAAHPLLLISDLADHTKNLRANPRCSLLVDGTGGLAEPLTGPRVTLMGTVEPADEPALLNRFTARHPGSAFYAGFGDFHLFRMRIDRAHLVAGFGRIHWMDGAAVIIDTADAGALADQESGVVEHMNEDHADAVGLYANVILGLPGVGWRLTGVDPEGADLRRGGDTARLPFDKPVTDAETARVELVRLVKRARTG
ncbi:MAG: DUF2470 domain-containing protein [Alphaproteobacteria bacterium]